MAMVLVVAVFMAAMALDELNILPWYWCFVCCVTAFFAALPSWLARR